MNLRREGCKIKRLNVGGSIRNKELFNLIHKTSNTSHRRKKGFPSTKAIQTGRKVLRKRFHCQGSGFCKVCVWCGEAQLTLGCKVKGESQRDDNRRKAVS